MLLRERHHNMTALLLGRQLRGGPVHRRPFVAEFCCNDGSVVNNPGLTGTPAFAAEYSKVYNDCKLLAIADEEGYVSIVDTACPLPTEMADDYGPNKPRAQWLAHRNAVFDIAWCNDDSQMLTASGDQTVALWDTGHADLLGTFKGHSGSVKTVSPMPTTHAVFASGARDGALMVWDARAPARPDDGTTGGPYHTPVITIQDAHAPSAKQRRRRTPLQGRTRPSVTSLTFLQGGCNQLATGGVDGVVKFWDLRQSAAAADEAAPGLQLERLCDAGVPPISQKQHGITSLALNPQGSQLLVSLTGGHHFIYDPLRPQIGPTRWFGGHTVASFYVKAGWSPDGTHIISGSTDRNVYIWEVDAPDGASPYVLPGHQGEVTAVAWCPSDFHQIATTADDATLKVWKIDRRQPEEQADDGGARHPWVYPWQQREQLAAAAAAAAAYGGVGLAPPGLATPQVAGLASASTAATPGGATPWAAARGDGEGSASISGAMLAGLRREGSAGPGLHSTARGGVATSGMHHQEQQEQQVQQQEEGEENLHANLHAPQQQQPPGTAGPPLNLQHHHAEQQQQRQGTGPAAPVGSARAAPYLTPFAAHTAGAAAASGSPATAAAAAGTGARTGGRPTARRIADLLNAAPSTRRTVKQQSIASFLRSPALGTGGASGSGAGQSAARKGAGSAAGAAAASSRDLGVGGSTVAGGGGGSALKRGSPLPGLGGSALPSPRSAKRLRTTFQLAPSLAAAAAAAAPAAAGAGPGSARASGTPAGTAASQLEPSPEQSGMAAAAAAAAAGKLGGTPCRAAGSMHRQQSGNENVLDMLNA